MSEAKPFDQTAPIKAGWNLMKKNFWFLAGVVLITLIVNGISQDAYKNHQFLVYLVCGVVSTFITIGTIKIILNLIDNKPLSYSELYQNGRVFWRYLSVSILYGLMVGLGTLALIIPGIYLAIKYQYAFYLVVDKDMSTRDAFAKSGEMTNGLKWDLFIFGVLLFGVIILGAIAFGIGLFAAIPTAWLAYTLVYRSLSNS